MIQKGYEFSGLGSDNLDTFENLSGINTIDGENINFQVRSEQNQIDTKDGVSFTYNANGDLTRDDLYEYGRDKFGRITSVTNLNSSPILDPPVEFITAATSGLHSEQVTFANTVGFDHIEIKINSEPVEDFILKFDGQVKEFTSEYDSVNQIFKITPAKGVDATIDSFTIEVPAGETIQSASYVIWQSSNQWHEVRYSYDATGRRISRSQDGVSGQFEANYVYSGMKMVDDGTFEYIYGTEINHVIAARHKASGVLLNTILDDRGTVFGLVKDGDLVTRYTYSAFGKRRVEKLIGDWDIPFGYTGMYIEPLLGTWDGDIHTPVYHTHFRDYDPTTGRWDREDPAGYVDGLNLYQAYFGVNGGLNVYGFVGNDSINLWDVLGLDYNLIIVNTRSQHMTIVDENGNEVLVADNPTLIKAGNFLKIKSNKKDKSKVLVVGQDKNSGKQTLQRMIIDNVKKNAKEGEKVTITILTHGSKDAGPNVELRKGQLWQLGGLSVPILDTDAIRIPGIGFFAAKGVLSESIIKDREVILKLLTCYASKVQVKGVIPKNVKIEAVEGLMKIVPKTGEILNEVIDITDKLKNK